ncbi:uncharacterized protein LOC114848792 [Betta splendens]|uniref:Uncharacterized protein LOC114848792 n=1 Tax=Betta splendens TaxID=158456 RepID=A0A6P7LN24_BETSP|nr:uncharacterized protein LOC114848792 [Betta splendens]
MDHRPLFRVQPSSTELTLRPSPEALTVAQAYHGSEAWKVKVPQKVKEEAQARTLQGGGDPHCSQLLLSQYEIQFGQYRGQTFKWLLSHDVGYAVSLLASHQKERESGDTSSSPLMANKDALTSYSKLFPEVMSAVEGRRATEGSKSVRSQDKKLVEFGPHGAMTYASMYEATGKEVETYVQWLRKKKCIPGSNLHALKTYILGRDQEKNQHPSQQPQCPPSDKVPSSASTPVPVDDLDLSSSGDSGVAVRPRTRAAAAAEGCPKPSRPISGSELLPHSWRQTLPEEQQDWVGRALFTRNARGQRVLTTDLRLWWYPPGARPLYTQTPASSHAFFQRPFFLWMPYRMWACRLVCPSCDTKLTGAGLYKTVRRVLDRDGWYFMGTEYLECRSCGKKMAAWVPDIINQLDPGHRNQFPAVLTYKLSCHKSVISQMRQRTLGNSATRLRKQLMEDHTETWMSCTATYLGVLKKLGVAGAAVKPVTVPPLHPVPTVGWLLSVFVRDALSRLEATKARVTSIFGNILKMESTKKMTSKLAGKAAGTAAWVTNVGNEYGQVLMSVLTAAEGDGLLPMAAGLMRRYREAQVAPPAVLYVGRDCCSLTGRTGTSAMFSEWDQLVVRLDVWHLCQRCHH